MAKQVKPIVLGCEARDKASGFRGIVTQWMQEMSGNIRFALQPSATKDALPDPILFDQHLLEWVGEGISKDATEPESMPDIRLGEKVKDRITEMEGIAEAFIIFMNGCVFVHVGGKIGPDGKAYIQSGPAYRLVVVGDGLCPPRENYGKASIPVFTPPPKVQPPSKQAPAKELEMAPGGPNLRLSQPRVMRR